jgi:hypothetical protein
VDRYTITDLKGKDDTWTADTVADLCTLLRARNARSNREVDNPGMSDALEEMCDALTAGQCIGNPRADGMDRATIRADRWEWLDRYRVWDAERKIFLYPENWLEPETRDSTPLTSEGPTR